MSLYVLRCRSTNKTVIPLTLVLQYMSIVNLVLCTSTVISSYMTQVCGITVNIIPYHRADN